MTNYSKNDRRSVSIKEKIIDMIPIGTVIGILLSILYQVMDIKEITYSQKAVNKVQDESIGNLKQRVAINESDIKKNRDDMYRGK